MTPTNDDAAVNATCSINYNAQSVGTSLQTNYTMYPVNITNSYILNNNQALKLIPGETGITCTFTGGTLFDGKIHYISQL